MKTSELLPSFTPSAPPTTKVTIEAPFSPIKNKTLRKLRPILRALGICRPCEVTFTLREMTSDDTYVYLISLITGFKMMSDKATAAESILNAVETGYKTSLDIVKMNAENMVLATGINDPEFFGSLQVTQSRILEQGIEEANPVLQEEKRRLEYVYLSSMGILEQAEPVKEGVA